MTVSEVRPFSRKARLLEPGDEVMLPLGGPRPGAGPMTFHVTVEFVVPFPDSSVVAVLANDRHRSISGAIGAERVWAVVEGDDRVELAWED